MVTQYFILKNTGKTSTNLQGLDQACNYADGEEIYFVEEGTNNFKRVDTGYFP